MMTNNVHNNKLTLIITLALVLIFGGMTTMSAHAWGLPKKSFNRAVEKALKKERWKHPDEAKEYWEEAIPKGEELMEALPDKEEYFLGTARAHYALGNYDKAIELYEAALKIKADKGSKDLTKDYPWVYVYLGLAYGHKGDTDKTIQYWEQVPMTIGAVYGTIQEQLPLLKTADTAEAQ